MNENTLKIVFFTKLILKKIKGCLNKNRPIIISKIGNYIILWFTLSC